MRIERTYQAANWTWRWFRTDCLAANIKYLLWVAFHQTSPPGEDYEVFLRAVSEGCAISPDRFRMILGAKASASDTEVQRIKRFFLKYDEERVPYLEYEFLFQEELESHKTELILDNIMFLIRTIPWGDNQAFIQTLQIRGSTLTRWKNGTMKPSRHFQKEICKYFGISDVDELKTAYLFLGLSPVSTPQRKLECKRLIDALDRETFEAIYPALLKLLN